MYCFRKAIWMPNYSVANVNKLQIVQQAVEAGLIVPKSMITNSKKELTGFLKNNKGIIFLIIKIY